MTNYGLNYQRYYINEEDDDELKEDLQDLIHEFE